jgi:hypothetical protein
MMDLASAICADLDARSMPFFGKFQNVEFFEFFKRTPDPKQKNPWGFYFWWWWAPLQRNQFN